MDIKEQAQSKKGDDLDTDKEDTLDIDSEAGDGPVKMPFIRTMAKDMNALSDKGAPPSSLPLADAKKPEVESPEVESFVDPPKSSLPVKESKLKQKSEVKVVKKPFPKFVLVSLIFVIIAGAIGGFFYWWNYVRVIPAPAVYSRCENLQCISVEGEGEDQCLIDQDCQPVEQIVVEPIIPVGSTSTVIFKPEQRDLIQGQLKSVVNQKQANDAFEWIPIKESGAQQGEYFSLSDFLVVLNLNFPVNVLGRITGHDVPSDNYTLFSFSQAPDNRLGLVIKLKQGLDLTEVLKLWESTITVDLKPLLLMQEIPTSFTETFQDNIYKDIAIRYMNFSQPDLSIDYAVVNDKLVITTSRENMYAAIDALLGE